MSSLMAGMRGQDAVVWPRSECVATTPSPSSESPISASEDQAVVVKATKPDPEVVKILAALGLSIDNPVVSVTKTAPAVA